MNFKERKIQKLKEKTFSEQELWDQERPLLATQKKIKEEKEELNKKELKLPSWSKLFLAFLLINFTILEVFIGWVTIRSFDLAFQTISSPDFTPLITLISAVVGETISYGIYCAKSKAENTSGGVVHDIAVQENSMDDV